MKKILLLPMFLSACATLSPSSEVSITEVTSPFPTFGIQSPHGARTLLKGTISCVGKAFEPFIFELPSGSDLSSLSLPKVDTGLPDNLFISIDQDTIYPEKLLISVRLGDRQASSFLPVNGTASYSMESPSCEGYALVTLSDARLAETATSIGGTAPALVPFPAEKQ